MEIDKGERRRFGSLLSREGANVTIILDKIANNLPREQSETGYNFHRRFNSYMARETGEDDPWGWGIPAFSFFENTIKPWDDKLKVDFDPNAIDINPFYTPLIYFLKGSSYKQLIDLFSVALSISPYAYDPVDQYPPNLIHSVFPDLVSTSIVRSKKFYENWERVPFWAVLDPRISERKEFFSLREEVSNYTCKNFYELIYDRMKMVYPYKKFPSSNQLFFDNRQKVYKKIIVDFDVAQSSFDLSDLSSHAATLLEEIEGAGGILSRDLRCDFVKELYSLSSQDRAAILEQNYLKYQRMDWQLADLTGSAFVQAGFPSKAMYFYFLKSFFPFESQDKLLDVEFYRLDLHKITRAALQYWFLGGDDNYAKAKKNICEEDRFFCNGKERSFSFFFGESTGEDRVLRHLALVENLLLEGQLAESNEAIEKVKDVLVEHMSDIESESFKVDFLHRVQGIFYELIDRNILGGQVEAAFRLLDFFKSSALKLHLFQLDRVELRQNMPLTWGKTLKKAEEFHDFKLSDIPDETVVVKYYSGNSTSGAFIAKKSCAPTFIHLEINSQTKLMSENLYKSIQQQRTAINKATTIKAYLKKLYITLIEPISTFLEDEKNVIIVPTGSLYQVPFSALYGREKFFIQTHNILTSPSFSIFMKCQKAKSKSVSTVNLIKGTNLPSVKYEEINIRQVFNEKVNLLNSLESVKEVFLPSPTGEKGNAEGFFHIASHGHFCEENPLLSSIVIGENDSIEVVDFYALDMQNVELALVNACVSGRSEVGAGDELMGLPRGFLVAGCSAMVNTLWRLSDSVGPEFAQKFYKSVNGKSSPLESFSSAIRDLLADPRFEHPYYWATYQYLGKI